MIKITQMSWPSVELCNVKNANSQWLYVFFPCRMCLVRMKQEGRSGKYMCRIIVHFMWEDVEQRGRIMGVSECCQILVLEDSNEGLPDFSWSFICFRMAWCLVVIWLESLLPLWRLTCSRHIIMVCQCEAILCTEMGLLRPSHGDRRDGFGKLWNQIITIIIQF